MLKSSSIRLSPLILLGLVNIGGEVMKLIITLKSGVEITQGDNFDSSQKFDMFQALATSFQKDSDISATSIDGVSVNAKFSDVKSIEVVFND